MSNCETDVSFTLKTKHPLSFKDKFRLKELLTDFIESNGKAVISDIEIDFETI